MKYILFGAGDIGVRAFKILGSDLVECFADNYKYGEVICGKKVLSFDEMTEAADKFRIVVTSDDYADELERQLQSAGIDSYVVFNRRNTEAMRAVLPEYNYLYNTQYMNYTDILLNYQIQKYKRIAIYGMNLYIDYLLLEIAILNDLRNVNYIIDPEIKDKDYAGIPVAGLENIKDDIDCLIINKKRTESGVRDETVTGSFDIIDIYDIDRFIFYNRHPELEKYKNIHKGKRAFIIGNGPSLTLEDLHVLQRHGEICFALNKIHKIFPNTKWRPDYICMTDARVIHACEDEIANITKEATIFMADRYCYSKAEIKENVQYVHLKSEQFKPNLPGFSTDITSGTNWGGSVTYDLALQIAAYMGFAEIYLIGIDHCNVGAVTDSGNHFIPDYFTQEEVPVYKNVTADFEAMDLAYRKADIFSRTHGFRIYNATRGGNLEIFERVDFDSLF